MDPGPFSFSPERMRALGRRVVDHLVERWAGLGAMPIPQSPPRAEVRESLAEPLPRAPGDPEQILDRAVRDVLSRSMPTGHPRFLGFIPSPSNFVAVLADALVAGFNPFCGNYVEAPGPHELERITVGWFRDACGLPAQAAGLFVSGGSMANLTALAVARTAKLGDAMAGARVYLSDQTHASVAKGLRVLGFPDDARVRVPTDARFAMDPAALREAIARDRGSGHRPFAVVATCGTTGSGAVDPLDAIADLCGREGLWMHVDGAYGAAAAFARERRAAVAGLERADSLSLDPHKWLFTPYECGLALVRDGDLLERAFGGERPSYLDDVATDEPDLQDMGVQLTRGFRALKVWATFQTFGADAIGAAIDAGISRAERVEARLRELPDWEVAAPASMAICAFRFLGCDDPDARNLALVSRLIATGEAVVTSTVLGGRRYLRMCTMNPRTGDADVERVLALLDRLARREDAG